jgi:hypothetical protein
MSVPFAAERLIERDVLGPNSGVDLYECKRGKLYRCRFCHLGFSPAENPASQNKARDHVGTQHARLVMKEAPR